MTDQTFFQVPFTGHRDVFAAKLREEMESERLTDQISLYMGSSMYMWIRERNERARQSTSDLIRELIIERMATEFSATWKRACELNGFKDGDLADFEPFPNGFICKGRPGNPEATLIHPDGRAWFCTYDQENGHLINQEPLFQE